MIYLFFLLFVLVVLIHIYCSHYVQKLLGCEVEDIDYLLPAFTCYDVLLTEWMARVTLPLDERYRGNVPQYLIHRVMTKKLIIFL